MLRSDARSKGPALAASFLGCLAALALLAASPARAQAYPTRPVAIIVPFAAGGGNDILARLLGQHMGVGHSGVLAMAPSLYAKPGYDPRKDFAPIGLIGSFQQVLVVRPSLPARTLAELIAQAKGEPGKMSYATAGVGSGSHLSTELFAAIADVRLTHVPFRGRGTCHPSRP